MFQNSISQEKYVIAPIPFGSLGYWTFLNKENVQLYTGFNFEKSSLMNRFWLNDNHKKPFLISIPIIGGRNIKEKLHTIQIFYENPWKEEMIKSIKTIYSNAPYFDYFGEDILNFIENFSEKNLVSFSIQSLNLIQKLVPDLNKIKETNELKDHKNIFIKQWSKQDFNYLPYYKCPSNWDANQILQLSILDILFNDAPHIYSFIEHASVANKLKHRSRYY
ncbi:MAG TPA: WbqC family protein [Chitinophagaceae bacterium]|nr:WbqC family protein [Chitinophagaceae bacterium]